MLPFVYDKDKRIPPPLSFIILWQKNLLEVLIDWVCDDCSPDSVTTQRVTSHGDVCLGIAAGEQILCCLALG